MKELSVQEISKHISKFNQICAENGEEINPMPEDKLITVYCKGTNEEGFADNIYRKDLGITALIAVSWIEQEELIKLCES